jgi:putative ABC transport system ATP-binding protein
MPGRVTSLLEAVQLEKRYVDGPAVVRVLEGLDLVVERGERIAIVGESGIGKSTLLHLFGALDRPTGGQVLFEGDDVFTRSETELAAFRNRAIGFIFQSFNLFPQLDVVENVEVPMLYAGVAAGERRARAERLVESVGLTKRRTHRPSELSGGEMQRVAIARALANEPVLILADEPTGNLDTATAEVIAAMLDDLHRKGATIVMVTHNPELGKRTSRVVRIRDGALQNEPG